MLRFIRSFHWLGHVWSSPRTLLEDRSICTKAIPSCIKPVIYAVKSRETRFDPTVHLQVRHDLPTRMYMYRTSHTSEEKGIVHTAGINRNCVIGWY